MILAEEFHMCNVKYICIHPTLYNIKLVFRGNPVRSIVLYIRIVRMQANHPARRLEQDYIYITHEITSLTDEHYESLN